LPLNSDIVGRALPERTIEVTPRMMLAYASGIGDDAQATFDDANARDFVASPFFCVSLEWQVVIANRANGLGLTPDEAVRTVHAGQNTRFVKPIRAGVRAHVGGEVVEVRQTKAGALARTRLDTRDEKTGELLASTLTTALYRGVKVDGPDRVQDGIADVTEAWAAPSAPQETRIDIDRWFPHRYTECASIWNPIHTERTVALKAGLPDIIVHGTALWALAGRTLVTAYAPNEPMKLKSLAGRFAAMVIPGSHITVRHGKGTKAGEVMFAVLNDKGEEAVAKGVASFG
jgi:acyl dehydratase